MASRRLTSLTAVTTVCAVCALLWAGASIAADMIDREGDSAVHLVMQAAGGEEVAADDVRVVRSREWLTQATRATGEDDKAVAATCVRLSRYLFDVTKQRVSALEVLEALAAYAPPGKPMQETTQRYFELRARRKLDHAGALAALAAGK